MIFDFIIIEVKNGFREFIKDFTKFWKFFIILMVLGLFLGLISFSNTPALICEDSITIFLEAKIINAYHGIPMYRWFHTPLYNYFLWIINLATNDNTIYLKLIQIIIHILSSYIALMAFSLKIDKKMAYISTIFYTSSYFFFYSTQIIHQEGLLELFFVLTLYFLFKYDKSHQSKNPESIWIWFASITLMISFFIKETCLIVLSIYYLYSILFHKTKFRDYVICAIILIIFVLPFLYVEYKQDWFIFKLYLSSEGDSFLSRERRLEFDKWINLILYDIISFSLCMIYIIKLVLNFTKKRKIGDFQIIALIIIYYNLILIISRSGILHMTYIIFFISFFTGPSLYYIYEKFISKIKKTNQINLEERYMKIKVIFIVFVILLNLCLIIPNLIILKKNKDVNIESYLYVSSIVQKNITYSQLHNAIGYYIENYYSDYSWYNSYKRNDFKNWSSPDVFKLTDLKNITDYGIQMIIRSNIDYANEFLKEITTNGTLALISEKNFTLRDNYWSKPYIITYQIYKVI